MIHPASWTPRTWETPSSRAPVQVRYHGPDGVHYQGGDQLSAGADDMLHLDAADIRNTEQRNPGSSAGECLWKNILGQRHGDRLLSRC